MANGKAPPHGRPWLSEKEIQDALWVNNCELMGETSIDDPLWLREPIIANGLMPDFVCIGMSSFPNEDDQFYPIINVVEVKITADSNSIVQLIHYANVIKGHSNLWYSRHSRNSLLPKVSMTLIARFFDKSVEPFLEHPGLDIGANRFVVEKDGSVKLEFEYPLTPHYSSENFDSILENHLTQLIQPKECHHATHPIH